MTKENFEVSNSYMYCILYQVKNLLNQKAIKKNKGFLDLCNSILCMSHLSDDLDLDNFKHDIHVLLEKEGIYKGL